MIYDDLLAIISHYLKGQKAPLNPTVNLKELYALSNRQGIGGLVYEAIKNEISDEKLKNVWKNNYLVTMQKGMGQEALFNTIMAQANQNHLTLVCYKGSVIKYLYPNPYLRLMGDLDFGFLTSDDKKLQKMMYAEGFKKEQFYGFHRAFVKEPYFEVEFHGSLHEDNQLSLPLYKSFITTSLPYNGDYVKILNPNMHYLFLITHLYQHMIKGGIGIRHFMDIYLFRKNNEIDEALVTKELAAANIAKYYEVLMQLIDRMFDGKNTLNDELYYQYLDYIFKGGIYGALDEAMREHRSLAATSNSKFKYTLRRLFPSFHDLSEQYKVLKKPLMWLLAPFFYLYRIITYFFKRKNFKDKLRFVTADIDPKEKEFALAIGLRIKKG